MSQHSHVETCASTGLPVCRRILNMNLALGYADQFYSLKALSQMHGRSEAEIFELGYDYVQGRECFRKEWAKMKSSSECPLPEQCQLQSCFSE